jgi:hypothetical protein
VEIRIRSPSVVDDNSLYNSQERIEKHNDYKSIHRPENPRIYYVDPKRIRVTVGSYLSPSSYLKNCMIHQSQNRYELDVLSKHLKFTRLKHPFIISWFSLPQHLVGYQ